MKIWNSPAGEIRLKRYPFAGERSHQAWDAADEWIVTRFPAQQEPVMITGEAFGALGTVWGNTKVTAAGDSLMSFEALSENRKLNPDICIENLNIIKTTDPAPSEDCREKFSKIFIRLPKSLELLNIFLKMITAYAESESEIWIGGMDKRWNRGTAAVTDKYLIVDEVFPFERHARWMKYKKKTQADTNKDKEDKIWNIDRYPVSICPSPAVFSSSSIDPGTSAFLEAFPESESKKAEKIVDLGCGSGILGLCAASLNPEAVIYFIDESYLAAENAEKNYKYNKLSAEPVFIVSNGADRIADSSQDLVLCNPPFHYQNIQTREPAEFLFGEALRILKPGGIIQIVGNSHLGYHKLLKKYFPEAVEIYRNDKFTVMRGEKS